MEYKLSKNDWIAIGKKTGWLKTAQEKKNRDFFITASEEEIKQYIDSIPESDAQELGDNLAGERDGMRENANSARKAALSADTGGDTGDYMFQLKIEREKIEVADKFAKALEMLLARFPNVKTPEPAKLMSTGESYMAGFEAEEREIRNEQALQEDADRRMRPTGMRPKTRR